MTSQSRSITTTATQGAHLILTGGGQDDRLRLDISKYPKLSKESAGHIRHFHNCVSQLDGQWNHMGTLEPAQEFLDALRYQLATMAYACGVAHYHRLPAARSVFKPLMRRLVHKMTLRSVWDYWFNTSMGGTLCDPDLKELRKPWADPVVTENIMYSGHLLLMTSLYGMLFDDDEYEKPDSIVFNWNPLFFGFGPEKYCYDNRKLQGVILKEMEKNGWVGVCCEPNVVFVVCNQFPITAMRYNDARDGTHVVEDVLEKYKAALEKKGMLKDGFFADMWMVKQDRVRPAHDVGWSAWAGTFMNGWNPDVVRSRYPEQSMGSITNIDGKIRLQAPHVASAFRNLVEEKGARPEDASTLEKAVAVAREAAPSPMPYTKPIYGYVVQWLSELGKKQELEALLQWADDRLNPQWEKGGLFYPRNDSALDENMDWTHMDPFTGNAAIGYARLNVENGQRIMWDKPWTKEVLRSRPWLDGVNLSDGIDCLRGSWDEGHKALILTMQSWDGSKKTVTPVAQNLSAGSWKIYVNGDLVKNQDVKADGSLSVTVTVGEDDADVVFMHA